MQEKMKYDNCDKLLQPSPGVSKAVVFEVSNYYIPYFSVALLSLVSTLSKNTSIDVIVLTHEVDAIDRALLMDLVKDKKNVYLKFFDPTVFVERYIKASRFSYLDLNYYRLALPWILSNYDVAVNLGADVLVRSDVSELLDVFDNNSEYHIAGVVDLGYTGRLRLDIPLAELGLSDPDGYVNADVLVLNLKVIRANYTQDEVMSLWQKYEFRCNEQDAYNMIYEGHIWHLELEWNVFPPRMASEYHISLNPKNIVNKWEKSLHKAKIVHFAAYPKPWDYPPVVFGNEWWNFAKKTPYYEEMLRRLAVTVVNQERDIKKRRIVDKFFPLGTKRRLILKRIRSLYLKTPGEKEWKKYGKCRIHTV